jgi:hypothetical protein
MRNKIVKNDEKIVLFLVNKSYEARLENFIVTLNVTRDFSFCLIYNSLKIQQFEIRF